MKKVVAIIVTYNRKVLLEECIKALLNQTAQLDIIIIDNCSTDNTGEMVKKYVSEKIKYFNTGKNLGGAGGFNYGMKIASKYKYDYCWIMDDDTIAQKNALETMLKKAKEINNNFSFFNSVVLWTDGTLCNMNIPKVSSKAIENYESLKNGLIQIDYCSFVSCLINMKYVKKIGFPITEFFIYGDDMEYTMRLSKEAPGYFIPDSLVVHKMTSNKGINIVDIEKEKIDRYYYNFRNLCYIYKKYDKKEYRIHKLKYFYLIYKTIFKAKNSRLKRIVVMTRGMLAGRKFNPKIEYSNNIS